MHEEVEEANKVDKEGSKCRHLLLGANDVVIRNDSNCSRGYSEKVVQLETPISMVNELRRV